MCRYSFGSQRIVSGFWTRMSRRPTPGDEREGVEAPGQPPYGRPLQLREKASGPEEPRQAPGRFDAAANRPEDERHAEECGRGPEPGVRPRQVPCEVERVLPMQASRDPEGRELPDDVLEPMEPANVPQDWGAAQPARRVDLDEMDPGALRSQSEATLEVGSIPLDRERDHPDLREAGEHPRPGPADRMFGTASRHGAVRVRDDPRDSRSAGVPASRRTSPAPSWPNVAPGSGCGGPSIAHPFAPPIADPQERLTPPHDRTEPRRQRRAPRRAERRP